MAAMTRSKHRTGPGRDKGARAMIDNLAIGITHLLMALAAFRLLSRADLDREPDGQAEEPVAGHGRKEMRLPGV